MFQLELLFSDDMAQFDTRERGFCAGEAVETEHWSSDFLDEAMVLLDHLVQVLSMVNHDQHSERSQPHQLIIDCVDTLQLYATFVDCHLVGDTGMPGSLSEEPRGSRIVSLF